MKAREPRYLCGATAIGKSAVAIELARQLGGEIISVDSMQVYRGMDIGTAKPTVQERQEVRHHLIDVADLTETFDAAQFVKRAREAEAEILGRGLLPIYCGGTGLYFNALLQGLGDAPASDAAIRQELEGMPLEQLLKELKGRDPQTFERIDRNNPRRVVRALEVIRITGKPFLGQRAAWRKGAEVETIIGLEMERGALHVRINKRVDGMFGRGLVEETRELLKRGLRQNRTASQALGYKQTIEHLDGVRGLDETIDLVKLKTRQFAKRQRTWFRQQLPVQWREVQSDEPPTAIASRLLSEFRLVGRQPAA